MLWDSLYQRDGLRYGDKPSMCARMASPLLGEARTVLEVGAGYGRDAIWLAERLPTVTITALDSSPTATRMLDRRPVANVIPVCQDAFDWINGVAFDALLSNFFYHIFLRAQRQRLFQRAHVALESYGLFINSFISIEDEKYGRGRDVEPGTYACYPDRPWHFIHFYSAQELVREHLTSGFEVEHIEEATEGEYICGSIEQTRFWFVVARKTD